jgi:hypothetical protein
MKRSWIYIFSLNFYKRCSSTLIEVNSLEVTVFVLIAFFSNNVITEDTKFAEEKQFVSCTGECYSSSFRHICCDLLNCKDILLFSLLMMYIVGVLFMVELFWEQKTWRKITANFISRILFHKY